MAIAEQEGNDLFQQLVKKGKEIERATETKKPSFLGESGLSERDVVLAALKALREIEEETEKRIDEALRDRENAKREALKRDLRLAESPEPSDRKTVEARQARRLESAKRAFLKEFGSQAKAMDCEPLLQERKILAVSHRNTLYVPSFQFDERGHPRPAVAKVIQILGKDTSDWGVALWFTAANGWLDSKRPVDLLKDEPEEVIQAAEQEAAELVF